jgi:formylglycine-generating enzyme required for sulfatase activity
MTDPGAIAMIRLPAGTVLVGSPDDERGRCPGDREGPQRAIAIARPFALAVTPVTRADFDIFARETGFAVGGVVAADAKGDWSRDEMRTFRDPGFPQEGDHPVVGIGWPDAVAYAAWLSAETGRSFRLPSEAEWEYAARAGTTAAFWWGDAIGPDDANCDHRHGYGGRAPAGGWRGGTCPVRSYRPNPWGFYQMAGNVWEWCADDHAPRLADLPSDGAPFRSGLPDADRTLRGGSYLNGPWNLRSACRLADPPAFRHASFGFRLACSLSD